jgi:hypothetical protein
MIRLSKCCTEILLSLMMIGSFMFVFLNSHAGNQCGKPSLLLKGNGIYEIKVADIVMEIDAGKGARILSFRLKDKEMLSTNAVHAENYGSTLWLSPQTWKWPPYPVLDREQYHARIKKNVLHLISGADKVSGFRMSKTIVANSSDSSFSINYTITNISDKDRSAAPWEVTRVIAGGITFFPIGPSGGYSKSNLATEDLNGICWFQYIPELITGHQKLFRNGSEGWLAHSKNGLMFIKQFPDISIDQEAPKETEIELYANKDKTYIELENQGMYKTLRPGESITWNVRWYLRQLPSNIRIKPGNADLSKFVRKTLRSV